MWIIFNFICVFAFMKGVTSIKVIRQSENITSWIHAQADCVSQGGDLLLMNQESIKAIERCNFSSVDVLWDGRYNTFSSWVIYKGCVQRPSGSDIASQLQLHIPGSVECAEHCRTYNPLFGIQNDTCYCFETFFSYIEINDTNCDIKCALREEPCGGQDSISVYEEVSAREVRPREDDIQPFEILCGLTECTPPNWKLYGYPCGRSLKAICNDGDVLSSNKNWRSSQNDCWQSREKALGGINLVHRISCSNNYQYINTPLWIQMRRDKVTRTVDGREVVPESTCFGGTIDNGTFSETDMDCNLKNLYVCIIDTDSPNCTDCPYDEMDTIPPCYSTTESSTPTMSTDYIMTTDQTTDQQDDTSTVSVTPDSITPSAAPIQSSENTGAIIGGTIGGVAGFMFCLMLLRFCLCRKNKPTTKREKYVSNEIEDRTESINRNALTAESNVLFENDISKDSTMLVRPTSQPSRQTDYVRSEAVMNNKLVEDVGKLDQTRFEDNTDIGADLQQNKLEDNDDNKQFEGAKLFLQESGDNTSGDNTSGDNTSLPHKSPQDGETFTTGIKNQENDMSISQYGEKENDMSLSEKSHEGNEMLPSNNSKQDNEAFSPPNDQYDNGTSLPQNNQQDNKMFLRSSSEYPEASVKDNKDIRNDQSTDSGEISEPVKSLNKESENIPKPTQNKPKIVSVINIGPISRDDKVTQL